MTDATVLPTNKGRQVSNHALARMLGGFSVGLGLTEMIAPRALCEKLGLQREERLVRAFGARELATGVMILNSQDPTPWLWGRVGGDALDLAVLATAKTDRSSTDRSSRGLRGFAILAVAGITVLDLLCAQAPATRKQIAEKGRGAAPEHSESQAVHGAVADLDRS